MESKFGSLLSRFESFVSKAEAGDQSDQNLDRFESLIERLEKVHYASGAQQPGTTAAAPTGGAGGASPFVQMFKDSCFKNVPALLDLTKEQGNEHLMTGTKIYLDLLNSQEAVLKTMGECSKPAAMTFMTAMVADKKKELFALGKPGRAVGTHLRVFEDSVGIFCWFQCPMQKSEFDITFGDMFGNIDFNGQKLCDMQPIDKKWFQQLRKVHKDFYDFIKAQFPKVLKWTGSNANAEQTYKASLGAPSTSAPVQAAPAKAEEKKVAAPAKPAEKKPKQPVKILRFKTWEISNYGAETIEFPAAEVNKGMTFNLFNCEKTTVIINGKFKNCMLSRCKGVKISVEESISAAEIIKSESIQLTVTKNVPQVSVEHCNGVQVFTTMESKHKVTVNCTASQSVSMVYPREPGSFDPNNEEEPTDLTGVCPETITSKLDGEKMVTQLVFLDD